MLVELGLKNVELGLKKIESLKLDKKNLLVKLFDANELLNNVKTENMLLLDKVKYLELDLSIARFASSKLDLLVLNLINCWVFKSLLLTNLD